MASRYGFSVADLMRLYRVSARKQLSQNFILDHNVTDKFARVAGDLRRAHVIEVGPGPGTLTRSILDAQASRVTVVEKDSRFLPFLHDLGELNKGRLHVSHGDILQFDYDDALATTAEDGLDVKIIGNLPFNIATPLLFSYLAALSSKTGAFAFGPAELALCFQKEVAERMVAPPKNKQRCGLSVMVQYFCEVDYAYELPSSVFVPRPKVDAAVVHLRPRADLYAAAGTLGALGGAGSAFVDFHTLEYTVRACFNGRRKMMRTNIRRLFAEPEDAVQALTLAGIQPESRPTDLTITQWGALARHVGATSPEALDVWLSGKKSYASLREARA